MGRRPRESTARTRLWQQRAEGETYRQIACEMLEAVHETWDWVIQHYHDPKANLLLSPSFAAEPEGEVPQWSRVFPLMVAGNVLVDASEGLGLDAPRAKRIDAIDRAMIAAFWKHSGSLDINGRRCVLYPYGIARLKDNPNHTEDVGHFGFDSRGFVAFYRSGRYFTREHMQWLANTLAENAIEPERGAFAERLGSLPLFPTDRGCAPRPAMSVASPDFSPAFCYELVSYAISRTSLARCPRRAV